MSNHITATEVRKSQRALYADIEQFEKTLWDMRTASIKRGKAWAEIKRKLAPAVTTPGNPPM